MPPGPVAGRLLGKTAVKTGPSAEGVLAALGEKGRTAGVLELDGEMIPLVSGKSGLPNYAATGHVEGQAALIMRERGDTSGRLLFDNPNSICGYCTSQVPTLLPKGAIHQILYLRMALIWVGTSGLQRRHCPYRTH